MEKVEIGIKRFSLILVLIILSTLFAGCGNGQGEKTTQKKSALPTAVSTVTSESTAKPTAVDYKKVKPDESGKIMVVMFHNFVQTFKPSSYDDGQYTTTFKKFNDLLTVLYNKGYRLISLNDYLENEINVAAGFIPMIFTFDDGTAGQFNLVEENGAFVANKNSAVGIMEAFSKVHPDFGLQGTFYVNLGGSPFSGKGSLAQRLKYLIDKGFEIGNHTMNHIDLAQVKSADKIREEIGGNQKKMYEVIPGYKMNSLSLPLGNNAIESLRGLVTKGEYKGTAYENKAIMMVGWDPALSPVSKDYNPLLTHRVRATGIKAVDMDLNWWLKNLSRTGQYISDGNPNAVSVPKEKSSSIAKSKLKGKKLNLY